MSGVPYFLSDATPLSDKVEKVLKPHMGNWMKIHAYIASLPQHASQTTHVLKQMLVYELHHEQRKQVVFRLYRKLAAARRMDEEWQLFRMVRS